MGVEEDEPVYCLSAGGLKAVVSRVSEGEFSVDSLTKNLEDHTWLVKKISLHQTVVEEAMRQGPVIPLKFITIFKTEASLLEALRPNEEILSQFLEEIRDKAEWALKVYLDEPLAKSHLFTTSQALKEMAQKPPELLGERYLFKRQMEKRTEEELRRATADTCEEIYLRLTSLSEASRRLKTMSYKATGIPQDMILNLAFLVANETLEKFRREVDFLAACYRQKGFLLQLSGPWPTYSFCPELPKAATEKPSHEVRKSAQ